MRKTKTHFAFFCVLTLFCISAGMAHPITPTMIVERSLDSSIFGVAMAAVQCTMFLFAPFWGKLCEYIPTRTIITVCVFGYSIGQIIFGSAYSEAMVIGGRMFAGVFTSGVYTAFSNYTINTSPDAVLRGKNLTIYLTISSVGDAVGYFVGGMLGLISIETTFSVQVSLLILAAILFFIFCWDDTEMKAKPTEKLRFGNVNPFAALLSAKDFLTPMLILIFALVALGAMGQFAFEQVFNYYLKDQMGLSSAYNGIFKAIIAIVGLIANSTICMWMLKKTDINRSFIWIVFGCALPLGLILFFEKWLIPFAAMDILFFAVNTVRTPLLQNMAAGRARPETSNRVMGFYQSMTSLGAITGSLFAGLIYDTNEKSPFYFAFLVFVLSCLIAMIYLSKYKKEKQK